MTTRTHVVTGDRAQVAAAMHRARLDGRLVAITAATALPGDRVRLVADLRPVAGSRWQRVRPWLVGVAKVLAVLAVLGVAGAVVWALVWAVMAVVGIVAAAIAWVHAHLLAIGLVAGGLVALLAWAGSAGGGVCGGLHCGGCRR